MAGGGSESCRGVGDINIVNRDFLALVFKSKLTHFVTELRGERLRELDSALTRALGIGEGRRSATAEPWAGAPAPLVPIPPTRARLGAEILVDQ